MKLRFKTRKKLAFLAVAVAAVVATRVYVQANSPRLVGTWKVVHDPWNTSLVTFSANGEYEGVTGFDAGLETLSDCPGRGTPCVSKGRFAESEKTFRLFDRKSYIRKNGIDVLFGPYADGSFNSTAQSEIIDQDKEMSKPKYFYRILSANWQAGILKVRSPDYFQYKGSIETWTRQ